MKRTGSDKDDDIAIEELDTDYLIIGAGAAAMAFADEILTRSKKTRLVLVDRRPTPGGHWNDAYPFVTLHQPALYYGVNSERLEQHPEDTASAARIVDYYQRVSTKLRETGRLRFFGECEYRGEGRFVSLKDDETEYRVRVHRRTVDATDSRVTIPSTHPPEYPVAEGMRLVPVNALADWEDTNTNTVVIGAGKTGIDAILRLLDMGMNPDRITWIVSNDAWLLNRAVMMPEAFAKLATRQLRTLARSTDAADYFRRSEAEGVLLRLDPSVTPTRFRCATVSLSELESLRRVPNIVRMGRVRRIDSTEIVLETGRIPTNAGVLHVDCSANGLARRPSRPIFDGDHLILQPVTLCQPTMSAAMIARIEARNISDTRKNHLSRPCPHPVLPQDYFRSLYVMGHNMVAWWPVHSLWMLRERLSAASHLSLWSMFRLNLGFFRWFYPASRSVKRLVRDADEAE